PHVVLHEQGRHRAPLRTIIASALDKTVHPAKHEIRRGISTISCAAEAKVARLPESVVYVGMDAQQFAAGSNFVHTTNPVRVVRKVVGRAVELSLASGGDAEVVCNGDRDLRYRRLSDIDTDRIQAERSGADAVRVVPADRKQRAVEQRRTG